MSGGELMAFTVPWNHVISQENQWGKLLVKNEQPSGRLSGGEVEISPTITETTETALSEIFGDPIGRLITTLQRMKAAPATYQVGDWNNKSPNSNKNGKWTSIVCCLHFIDWRESGARKSEDLHSDLYRWEYHWNSACDQKERRPENSCPQGSVQAGSWRN